jgi:hypothetical protein
VGGLYLGVCAYVCVRMCVRVRARADVACCKCNDSSTMLELLPGEGGTMWERQAGERLSCQAMVAHAGDVAISGHALACLERGSMICRVRGEGRYIQCVCVGWNSAKAGGHGWKWEAIQYQPGRSNLPSLWVGARTLDGNRDCFGLHRWVIKADGGTMKRWFLSVCARIGVLRPLDLFPTQLVTGPAVEA